MGHTYANLLVHTVFSTKGRRPLIRESFRERLHRYMGGVARNEFGRALAVSGTEDHVHGLISLNTDVSVADAMRKWKSLSSGWVNKTDDTTDHFAWQAGYAAFSVSQSNKQAVTAYIENQPEHHRKRTFQEEFVELLERHGIDYDPRYLFG